MPATVSYVQHPVKASGMVQDVTCSDSRGAIRDPWCQPARRRPPHRPRRMQSEAERHERDELDRSGSARSYSSMRCPHWIRYACSAVLPSACATPAARSLAPIAPRNAGPARNADGSGTTMRGTQRAHGLRVAAATRPRPSASPWPLSSPWPPPAASSSSPRPSRRSCA